MIIQTNQQYAQFEALRAYHGEIHRLAVQLGKYQPTVNDRIIEFWTDTLAMASPDMLAEERARIQNDLNARLASIETKVWEKHTPQTMQKYLRSLPENVDKDALIEQFISEGCPVELLTG